MSKIAIIGAGNVGATMAYTFALFGTASEIALIDINETKARGEALDISHGMPLCPPAKITGGGYELLCGEVECRAEYMRQYHEAHRERRLRRQRQRTAERRAANQPQPEQRR